VDDVAPLPVSLASKLIGAVGEEQMEELEPTAPIEEKNDEAEECFENPPVDEDQSHFENQFLSSSPATQNMLLRLCNESNEELASILNSDQYVPVNWRKFLLCLVETFGSICHHEVISLRDLQTLQVELSKKTSANPDLSREVRNHAIRLFAFCKDFLFRKGYEEEPNGLWLQKMEACRKESWKYSIL
jgi:hypothetical protein